MTRIPRTLAALALALVVGACSAVSPPVALRTERAPSDACLMALMSGTLTKNPDSGLGVTSADGSATPVEWPFGYSARVELGRTVLVDETGKVLAREGDEIEIGGGLGDRFWHACAGVTVTKPGS